MARQVLRLLTTLGVELVALALTLGVILQAAEKRFHPLSSNPSPPPSRAALFLMVENAIAGVHDPVARLGCVLDLAKLRGLSGEKEQARALVEEARRLMQAIPRQDEINAEWVGCSLSLVEAQVAIGDVEPAFAEAHKLVEGLLAKPHGTFPPCGYYEMILVFSRKGEHVKATRLAMLADVGECLNPDWRQGRALLEVVRQHLGAGDQAGAESAAGLIRHPACRTEAWAKVACGHAIAGARERARQALRFASMSLDEIQDPQGAKLRDVALIELCAATAALGTAEQAQRLLEELVDPDHRAIALAAIAAVRVECGDLNGGFSLLDRINTVEDGSPRARGLDAILRVQLRQGKIKDALLTMSIYVDPETYRRPQFLPEPVDDLTCLEVARCEWRSGDMAGQRMVREVSAARLSACQPEKLRARWAHCLGKASVEFGDKDEFLHCLSNEPSQEVRIRGLLGVLAGLAAR